jgi:hypothetical protein
VAKSLNMSVSAEEEEEEEEEEVAAAAAAGHHVSANGGTDGAAANISAAANSNASSSTRMASGGRRSKNSQKREAASSRSLEDRVHVKMIDFAHVLPAQHPYGHNSGSGNSLLDTGYLHGLRTLITNLHQVMKLEAPDIRQVVGIQGEGGGW